MGYDPGGVEEGRSHVWFDPFGVGIDFPVCTVGYTHGYSHSGPFGAGPSKGRTLIQWQWGRGEGRALVLSALFRLSGLFHKYAHVRCSEFGLWRGAREGVYPQRYSTDRATKPQAKFGATLRAACLLAGGVVARSLQIHVGICSSLAPSLRPKSIAANVCVFMK